MGWAEADVWRCNYTMVYPAFESAIRYLGMTNDVTGQKRVFPRTEGPRESSSLWESSGGILLVSAFVLGLTRLIADSLAVVMFGVGGYLLLCFLLLYWRGRSRIRQLRCAMEANQTAVPEMIEQMRKVDPRWLAVGALVGLALAAGTIAFAVVCCADQVADLRRRLALRTVELEAIRDPERADVLVRPLAKSLTPLSTRDLACRIWNYERPTASALLAYLRAELSKYPAFVSVGDDRWSFGRRLVPSIEGLAKLSPQ